MILCSFLVRYLGDIICLTCVSCPVYPLQVWYLSGSRPVVDQDNRTLTDINRIRTGGVTHEFRTNRKLTYEDRTSNGGLCPFYPVENFEHAQNFPTGGTDVTGHRRTRNGFTGY
ncbi:hypothetical protein DPMN_076742 [Dreissena polymorpha]|uniref:Secreted protein n=1 Tax=Dreissena polymorpha TaxID=45954 RepID=A0A9D4BQS0_DREPO|nr:hypothetical protein DPMN_076742 [Dreissena polymorpha]